MSILKRKWHLYPKDDALAGEISSQFKISKIISQILLNRGIKTHEEISAFLHPRLSSLRDPFEIPDMKKASARVLEGIRSKEKMLVYGDYDVDGVTATSILVLALKQLGADVTYYIPHRYDEGYGLNTEAIKMIAGEGIKLIITVDCGISNFKEIDLAASLGMDVIVTDHHNIPDKLPGAYAIIDYKLLDAANPSRDLSGAGVAFKFAWALFRSAGISDSMALKGFLDLATLGTVADIVPLTGENRTIVVSGIKLLNEKSRVGVRHLAKTAGIENITAHSISFMIAPRLNAPGRLKHAGLSMKLLLENDYDKASLIADEINGINKERQQIGNLIGEEAFSKLENFDEKKLIILTGKGWHPGVIGIVSSKISERFNRPSILISEESNGSCRGSARSVEGFDVYKLLLTCRDLFIDFGGHKDAAGFEMLKENIPLLEKRLSKEIEGCLSVDNIVPRTKIDYEVDPSLIDMDLASELLALEPFGSGNPAPMFLSKGIKIMAEKTVGSSGRHLKLKLSDGKTAFEAIGFGLGMFGGKLKKSAVYDIAYNININNWDGFETAQVELVDMREVS